MTVTSAIIADLPDADTIAAVSCPIERARLVTEIGRRRGNLPPDLAEIRGEALVEARAGGQRKIAAIAAVVGVRPSRISTLIQEHQAKSGAPCPPWCEARHGLVSAHLDDHLARCGQTPATLMRDPDTGEPADIGVEITQLPADPEPVVSVLADWLTEPLRLTAGEADQLGRLLIKVAADVRTMRTHLRRCRRPTTEAA